MKNKWEIETKDSPVKNEVLPITVPVIRNDFNFYEPLVEERHLAVPVSKL